MTSLNHIVSIFIYLKKTTEIFSILSSSHANFNIINSDFPKRL